jgi:glucose dehydrogenase
MTLVVYGIKLVVIGPYDYYNVVGLAIVLVYGDYVKDYYII